MKVWLVWSHYPFDPESELLKVFKGEKKANEYIDRLISSKTNKESELSIEEREVE